MAWVRGYEIRWRVALVYDWRYLDDSVLRSVKQSDIDNADEDSMRDIYNRKMEHGWTFIKEDNALRLFRKLTHTFIEHINNRVITVKLMPDTDEHLTL